MIEKRKNRPQALLVGLIAVCAAVIIFTSVCYLARLQDKLENNELQDIVVITLQQRQALDDFISNDLERLHSYADHFSRASITEAAEIEERLDMFSEVSAEYGVVCFEEKLAISSKYSKDGSKTVPMSEALLEEYGSLSGSGVRDNYLGAISGEPRFGFYETFLYANGHHGLIQKSYARSEIMEAFNLSLFNGHGYGFILNQDGDILRRSDHIPYSKGYTNVFQALADLQYPQGEIDTLHQALDRRETGSLILNGEDGEYVCTYVPLESVEGWHLLSVVPLRAVSAQAASILRDTESMVGVFALLLILCIAAGILTWHISKSMAAKDRRIQYQSGLFDVLSRYIGASTDDVYAVLDHPSGKVEFVTPNMERVLGISTVEEALAYIRTPTAAQAAEHEAIRDHYAGAGALSPDEMLPALNTQRRNPRTGEKRYFLENTYCVEIQAQQKRVSCLSDRSKERKTQDSLTEALHMAEAANAAKTAFLSSMSHDIRTPMNAITGFLALIQEEADVPPVIREYTQRIDAASQHLLSLINDVLDMNKIESGSATLSIAEISLADIISQINTIIRPQTEAKGQSFAIHVAPMKQERLLGDKTRIDQILINLLSNAVKYTPENGTIRLEVEELPQVVRDYSRVRFTVSDNGLGMSEEYQKVLFDPFTREETGTQIQGTGLGMAITKSLVDLMKGTIRVESSPGRGSTFTVELELSIPEQEDDLAFWAEHKVSRIIVADDDGEVCSHIVKTMSPTGVETDCTAGGEALLQKLQEARAAGRPYDIVLLDWQMPGLDGLETARLIRRDYPDKIPIVLLTAYDWNGIKQEALEAGVDQFMPKPFFVSAFRQAVRRLMGSRRRRESGRGNVFWEKQVLVVDDIEVNRMILTKILGTLGAVCRTACNGQEAVEQFEASRPGELDLIMMDVQMPVLGGYDAARAIRASAHPSARQVPIVAMTANAFVDDVREAIESGMDAHIAKPVQLEVLKTTVQQVLEKKAACRS